MFFGLVFWGNIRRGRNKCGGIGVCVWKKEILVLWGWAVVAVCAGASPQFRAGRAAGKHTTATRYGHELLVSVSAHCPAGRSAARARAHDGVLGSRRRRGPGGGRGGGTRQKVRPPMTRLGGGGDDSLRLWRDV